MSRLIRYNARKLYLNNMTDCAVLSTEDVQFKNSLAWEVSKKKQITRPLTRCLTARC